MFSVLLKAKTAKKNNNKSKVKLKMYCSDKIDVIRVLWCSKEGNRVDWLTIMRSYCSKGHLFSVIPYLYLYHQRREIK
jgi:hypothetical protein